MLKIIRLSLRYGNSADSAHVYASYGMLAGTVFGNLKAGYEFGKLALALSERFRDKQFYGKILYIYAAFIYHWSEHLSGLTPICQKGIEASQQAGDLMYVAANCATVVSWDPTLHLDAKCQALLQYLPIIKKTQHEAVLIGVTVFRQMLLNFCGHTDHRLSLNDESFDESNCLDVFERTQYLSGISEYHTRKAEICCAYEEYARAADHITEAEKTIKTVEGRPLSVRYCFLAFLSFAGASPEKPSSRRRLRKARKQMTRWAAHCPVNFLHLRLIMDAELARLFGKPLQAAELYDRAIDAAHEQRWLQDEALANELAAKFYLRRGQEKIAGVYMQEARYLYSRWGATRKVEFLEERYPQLLTQARTTAGRISVKQGTTTPGTTNLGAELDLHTVMKASPFALRRNRAGKLIDQHDANYARKRRRAARNAVLLNRRRTDADCGPRLSRSRSR